DALHAAKAAFGKKIARKKQSTRNGCATRAIGRHGRQLGDESLGLGPVRYRRPGYDDLLHEIARPFHIGDCDLAMHAIAHGVEYLVMHEGGSVAVTLDV